MGNGDATRLAVVAVQCRITDDAKRSEKIKGGTYRMVKSAKSGRYIPRDCTYPLDGPEDVAKSGIVEERKKLDGDTGKDFGGVEVPGAGGPKGETPDSGSGGESAK